MARLNRYGMGEAPDPLSTLIQERPLSQAPSDVRRIEGPDGQTYNIVQILPRCITLHARRTLSVTPAGAAQFDVIVGTWFLRGFDGYAIAVDFELTPDNDANLGNTYLRVGDGNIPSNSQNATITNEVGAFWTQITGTKGSKSRVPRLFQPYGWPVPRDVAVIAALQYHTLGAGVAFNIEYDVQIRVLTLENMALSGY